MRGSVTLMDILFPYVTKYLIRSTPTRVAQSSLRSGWVPDASVRISHLLAKYNKTKAYALVLLFAEDERFELSEPFTVRQFSKLLL
jgi:hypothetical protein